MSKRAFLLRLVSLPLMLAVVTGCATTQQEARTYDPYAVPSDASSRTMPPTISRSMSDLLRDADDAFQAANAAQEAGDQDEALQQYNRMLSLLVKADLDPEVYYSLRNEFARILGSRPDIPDDDLHQWEDGMVAGGLPIPLPLPYRVQTEKDRILKGYPRNFQYGLRRAQKYLPYIEAQLEKEGLPKEIAWLAMVESQFTPRINSHAGAGGMWQFMPATGRRYGLRIDRYVDERYDWQKATHAAIAYLKDLYAMFDGEWPLAISAYNMGEYGLQRAIVAAGGERDLWTLVETPTGNRMVPEETKCFYPKLLASVLVSADAETHGFSTDGDPPDNTATLLTRQSYSLAAIERATGLSNGTLERLNPQFLRGITPPTGEYELRVPADTLNSVTAALTRDDVRYHPGTHTVRRGETLSHIASRYGVSVQELQTVNNISSPRLLRVGRNLVVPGHGGQVQQAAVAAPRSGASATATVRRGQTLSHIAQANGVSVRDLQQWNGMGNSTVVHAGDSLVVSRAAAAPAPAAASRQHVVKAGENPGKIAQQYKVSLNDLLAWNNLNRNSIIRVGDTLVVRGGPIQAVEQTEMPAGEDLKRVIHTVAAGESPYTIARKYGVTTNDLLAWNNLNQNSRIHPGNKLTVYVADGEPVRMAAMAPPPPAQERTITHVVTRGQSPWGIARRYDVTVDDLNAWNGWSKNHMLRVGDRVVIKR